jgi:transcriptional regulator with PAS, ATPase and Fis domain
VLSNRDPFEEGGRFDADPPGGRRESFGSSPSPDSVQDCSVILLDRIAWRRDNLKKLIEESGARPICVANTLAIQNLEATPGCGLALVAVEGAADRESLEFLQYLREKKFRNLSYGDGAQSWPLNSRCLVLLSGASQLLDCQQKYFEQELRNWIIQSLRLDRARAQEKQELKTRMNQLGIVGESASIRSVFKSILKASFLSDLPIILTGETGTGKELFAQALYRLDPKRNRGPFVSVNCGALSSGLVESELFGHRRGAFTGAERTRKGLIRSADGGVLFLDEIGDLDSSSQVKLLRVLQENKVLSVGEDEEVPVSIRVISATNRPLDELVRKKDFREDLFHRLNVISVRIPPLRERAEDIAPLVTHFLQKYRSITGGNIADVQQEFVAALGCMGLPGNARQLENLIRQTLVAKVDAGPLSLADLPEEVLKKLTEVEESEPFVSARSVSAPAIHQPPGVASHLSRVMQELMANGSSLASALRYFEKMVLEEALRQSKGNQSQTARLLGITPRSVYNKLRKYRLLN